MNGHARLIAFLFGVLLSGCARQESQIASAAVPAPTSAPAPVAQQASNASQSAYQAQMARDQSDHPTLAIGSAAPDFALQGVDGKLHRLADYKSRFLAIVFVSNHCPASQLYEGRIKALVDDYAAKGLTLIAIAPNGPAAVSPHELNYSDVDDSLPAMKLRAEYRKFNFAYLYDGDTQAVSHQYGPKVTPHLFVFDAGRKLVYEGRIDDHLNEAKVKTRDARNALDELVAGKPVTVAHTPVFGCSTKWMSHAEAAKSEMQEWLAQPVKLEAVDAAGLAKLRANGSGKMLMVNFWATWCAPCQTEYPSLLETYLWYRTRDFDFVSVSVDAPEQKDAVLKFLQKTHSGIRNLQVDSDDVYAVMAAFDKTWESGVPFTMIIAADGKVLYQHSGAVDLLKMRRTILANLPDAGMFAGNAAYWRQ